MINTATNVTTGKIPRSFMSWVVLAKSTANGKAVGVGSISFSFHHFEGWSKQASALVCQLGRELCGLWGPICGQRSCLRSQRCRFGDCPQGVCWNHAHLLGLRTWTRQLGMTSGCTGFRLNRKCTQMWSLLWGYWFKLLLSLMFLLIWSS